MSTKKEAIFLNDGMSINPIKLYDYLNRQILLRSPVMDDYDAGFKDCLTYLAEALSSEISESRFYGSEKEKEKN